MDVELLKTLVKYFVIGGILGWLGAVILTKFGFGEFEGLLILLAASVAWGYCSSKKEQAEQATQIEDYIAKEVERRTQSQ